MKVGAKLCIIGVQPYTYAINTGALCHDRKIIRMPYDLNAIWRAGNSEKVEVKQFRKYHIDNWIALLALLPRLNSGSIQSTSEASETM